MHRIHPLGIALLFAFTSAGCGKQLATSPKGTETNGPAAVVAPTANALPTYTLKDLGTFSGGVFSSAVAISPSGTRIAGNSNKSDGTYDPATWSSGALKDLGNLGGGSGNATGVNNNGQVVGTSYLSGGGWHAFYYSGSQMKDMGKLSGFNSGATGVNTSGLVIGSGDLYGGWTHGFTYQIGATGGLKELSTLGGKSCWANAVNDAGLIVGQSNTPGPDPYSAGGALHACSWTNRVIKDLGTLAGPSGTSSATAVSSNGLIAGWSTGPNGNHAVTFANGAVKDLGTITGFKSTRATAINAAGTVVGLATNGKYGGNSTRAFVYSAGAIDNIENRITNLNGKFVTQLNAINDAGVIVGVAVLPNNAGVHAIQLTPQ